MPHKLHSVARRSQDAGQTRQLLALAAIYDGATRTEAATVGGVTLQIVRDWVLKLNERGPNGLVGGMAAAVAATGRFPVKVVADTLGVARSHLVKQLAGVSKPRGRYQRQGDDEVLTAIRQLTDARPTYGYRRITALLNRARRASGAKPINYKRIFRLMAQGQLLLQPHVGHRPIRAHECRVIALASNQRWSSDGLEINCWNGEIVRLVFAIDTCDREIIAW